MMNKALRTDGLRIANKINILKFMRNREDITKPDIQKELGLSAPTVSHLVDELVEEGFVRWNGIGASTDQGGKRPNLYSFNGLAAAVIAVHVGSHFMEAALLDLEAKVRYIRRDNIKRMDKDRLLEVVTEAVRAIIDKAREIEVPAIGIGIGWSGVVSYLQGTVLESVNFNLNEHLELGPWLKARFGLPVWIDHEANNLALAERWFGYGGLLDTMIVLSVDEGIGSGFIVNNQLVRGEDNSFGEVGHSTININGPLCRCGRRGCWETYASMAALVEQASVASGEPAETLSVQALAQRVRSGDRTTERLVFGDYLEYMSAGLANIVNVFNPNVIILHGGVALFGDSWLDAVAERVKKLSLPTPASRVKLRFSGLGEHANLVGSGALCIQELFETPDLLFSDHRLVSRGSV